MDGGNGGWAVLNGGSPVAPTTLQLAIDEDQVNDTERAHTTEQVAYFVIDSPPAGGGGSVNGSPAAGNVSGPLWHDAVWGVHQRSGQRMTQAHEAGLNVKGRSFSTSRETPLPDHRFHEQSLRHELAAAHPAESHIKSVDSLFADWGKNDTRPFGSNRLLAPTGMQWKTTSNVVSAR